LSLNDGVVSSWIFFDDLQTAGNFCLISILI
jgi:hypothetical protein